MTDRKTIRPIMLRPESPIVIDPYIAEDIGLNEAIMLHQIMYWVGKAKSSHERGKGDFGTEHDGKYWFYCSADKWREDNFPFWSVDTIRRTANALEKLDLIDSKRGLNGDTRDRTKWYSLNTEHDSFVDPLLVANMQNAHLEDSKEPSSKPANRKVGRRQNGNLLIGTENTSENTTENTSEIISPPAKASGGSDTEHITDLVIEGETKPKRKAPPKRAAWGNRSADDLFDIVSAWCKGRGHDYKSLPGTTRNRATAIAKKLPEKYTAEHIYECTLYVMSDPWKAENKSDFIHIAEALPLWESKGKPNATLASTGRSWRQQKQDNGLSVEQLKEMAEQLRERENGQ